MDLFLLRRNLLKALALATVGVPISSFSQATLSFTRNPFALGVASGSPTAHSIVLWTRLIDEGLFGSNLSINPIEVNWELSEDIAFTRPVKSGVSLAVPDLAYSVHAEIDHLPANRWFFYRFRVGGMVSPIGRTRTLPLPNAPVDSLRIAFASCQNYEHGYYAAYKHMLNEDLDLVMFLGDYIYEYGPGKNGVRFHDSGPAIDLDDYRKRYVLYKKDENLQAMHASCPWLFTWDDHEVQNDYAGLVPGITGPYVDDFAKRRASAYQAYYEHMPITSSALINGLDGLFRGVEMRIYGNFKFGRLANISMLDDRQYRDPEVCVPSGRGSATIDPSVCVDVMNSSRTMLGSKQEKWIQNTLKDSDKNIWNIIGQATLYAQRKLSDGEKALIWSDGWDGYPAARKNLDEQFIKNKVKNLVIFGGDVHENWVGYLKENYDNPNSAVIGVEFCGTSISSMASGAKYVDRRLEINPHFIFADGAKRGYGVAEFTPKQLIVTLRVLSNARDEEATITSLAKFSVDSGSNHIKRIS